MGRRRLAAVGKGGCCPRLLALWEGGDVGFEGHFLPGIQSGERMRTESEHKAIFKLSSSREAAAKAGNKQDAAVARCGASTHLGVLLEVSQLLDAGAHAVQGQRLQEQIQAVVWRQQR